MSFTPLWDHPWRQAGQPRVLPPRWVAPALLAEQIDSWRGWLQTQPGGRWILCLTDPLAFTAALLALWETGRIAVLPADDLPGTLDALATTTDGQIPAHPPVAQPAGAHPGVQLMPGSIALALYTSGSTGQPVEITKTFAQLQAELAVHHQLWPLHRGSCVIAQVSHQHIYGLLAAVLHPLCSGVPFSGGDCHYPEHLAERISQAGEAGLAPVMVSSPAQLARLPEHIRWSSLPRLQRVFSSGAPLAGSDAARAEQLLNAPVIEIYGSTETGGIATRRQAETNTWQALPGVELSFEGERLALRSAFLADPDHWWQQQDRVQGTAQGFQLLGRGDRLAKIGGKRVSLDHIETLLAAYPLISAARCVELGRSDGRLGCILVMAAADLPQEHQQRRELISELRTCLAEHIEQVAIPRYWRCVETLPSNAQGKLDRSLISRLFEDLDDRRQPRWLGTEHRDAQRCLIALEVPERLIFLDGHFEQFPIVPGVVIVQWAIEQAERSFGSLGVFSSCEQLKFQLPMRPGMRLQLELTRRETGMTFAFHSHEGRHANGRISFTAASEPCDD